MIFDVPCFLSGLIICLSSLPTIQITSIGRPPTSSSYAAAVAAAVAATAAAAITFEFHQNKVTEKHKTKHIMKISHIKVNIYDKAATSQQNSD